MITFILILQTIGRAGYMIINILTAGHGEGWIYDYNHTADRGEVWA